MKQTLLIGAFFLTVYFSFSQPTFYVQSGNNITKVENGDPLQLNVKEWQVRLYRRNAPNSGNNYWGKIKGRSADEVMQKLKTEQEFELRFNAFVGKGSVQDESLTHFDPLGPIAVTDDFPSIQSPTDERVEETSETYKEAAEFYLNAYFETKKRLDVILKGKLVNPYDNYGSVFKEYTGNLTDVIRQIISVRTLIEKNASIKMEDINNKVNSIDSKLQRVYGNREKLNTMIDETNRSQNKSDEAVSVKSSAFNRLPLSSIPDKYKTAVQTIVESGRKIFKIRESIPPELFEGMNEQQIIYFKNFVDDMYYYAVDMAYCFGLLSTGAIGYGYLNNNQIHIDEADQYYRDNVLQNDQILQTSNYNNYYSRALLEKGNTAYDLFKLLDSDPNSKKVEKNKLLQYGIASVNMVYQQAADGYQDASVVKDKQVLLTKLKQVSK